MVYVQSKDGQPIMPTEDHRKVRLLLKSGKAKVVKREPFTIRLLGTSKTYTQEITLGVDAGSKHVGLSACTEQQELFCAELRPRNDVVELMSTRREFRRARRNRKRRYRSPRFKNRTHSKHKGWLAPSVEVKIHNHVQGIRLVMSILPISRIRVETAEFDLHRMKNYLEGKPSPEGEDYQHGEMYDQCNVRQYVFFRDGYTCQICGAHPTERKPVKLHAHHIESRKTGGDAPSNQITLCVCCHKKLHAGLVDLPPEKKRRYRLRDATFMGIMRKTLMQRLREMCDILVTETYGYVTKTLRETYEIPKSHTSDARCIARAPTATRVCSTYLLKPVRRHNRQIHKATISKGGYRKKNQSPKYVFGFRLFDMVQLPSGDTGFVFGRRSSGSFDVRHLNGKRISAGISCKKLSLLCRPSNLLCEQQTA